MLPRIRITNETGGPIVMIAAVDHNVPGAPVGADGTHTLLLDGETVEFFKNPGVSYVLHHPEGRYTSRRVIRSVLKDGTERTDSKVTDMGFDFDKAVAQRLEDDRLRATTENSDPPSSGGG